MYMNLENIYIYIYIYVYESRKCYWWTYLISRLEVQILSFFILNFQGVKYLDDHSMHFTMWRKPIGKFYKKYDFYHMEFWCRLMFLCAPLCLSLWGPMGCSLPRTFVYEISQERTLESVEISSSREFLPKNWTYITSVTCNGTWIFFFYHRATWESSWKYRRD